MGNIIYRKTIRQIRTQVPPSPVRLRASQTGDERNNSILLARLLRLLRLFSSVLLSPAGRCYLFPSQCACLHTGANSRVGLDPCQHLHWPPLVPWQINITGNIFRTKLDISPPPSTTSFHRLSPGEPLRLDYFLPPQSVADSLG